jgi:cytochrome c553
MKIPLLKIAALLGALGAAGFLVTASGIIPIRASSGHFAITHWFLSFSMRQAISTQSMNIKAPSLEDPALVLKGAGHYELGCRTCHGSPSIPSPRMPRAMTPAPPSLSKRVAGWDAEELFYIVKHGIKFTGMPAWPAQRRDDEVWAMVAFLRVLPGLDAREYRRLVDGEQTTTDRYAPLGDRPGPGLPSALKESCGRCHGTEGLGRGLSSFPILAGQSPAYLIASLEAFARGARHSGIMELIATELRPEQMREFARYYGGLTAPPRAALSRALDIAASIERGAMIARRGIPSQGVPSCVACHGPITSARNPMYPKLAGQYADYLVLQLELFARKDRGGTAYAHLMHPVARDMTQEQMRDVAQYYESLSTAP